MAEMTGGCRQKEFSSKFIDKIVIYDKSFIFIKSKIPLKTKSSWKCNSLEKKLSPFFQANQVLIGALIGAGISALIVFLLIQFYEVKSANEIKVDFLKPIIGIFIIWFLFLKGPKKEKKSKSFIKVGSISGLSSIFIGATGPLIAPFFLNHNLIKEEIIANKAACQMITHLSKIPLFIYFFNFNYIEHYSVLIPLIIAVFVGTNFGKKILSFIPEHIFIILFKSTLFIIAIKLIFSYQIF